MYLKISIHPVRVHINAPTFHRNHMTHLGMARRALSPQMHVHDILRRVDSNCAEFRRNRIIGLATYECNI